MATKSIRRPGADKALRYVEIDDEFRNAWDRQPWDTDTSYNAFIECYLAQSPPRTIAEAYVRWQKKNNRKVRRTPNKKMQVPIAFYNWSNARDVDGQRPIGSDFENALTWVERAAAFDDDVYRKRLSAIRRKQTDMRDKEYEAGDVLLDRAMAMIAARPAPTDFLESDVTKYIDMAFKLMRRALQMPTDNKEIMVKQWRDAMTEAGLDPDTVFEETVNALVEQLESSDSE
jgi:hypothetical protein